MRTHAIGMNETSIGLDSIHLVFSLENLITCALRGSQPRNYKRMLASARARIRIYSHIVKSLAEPRSRDVFHIHKKQIKFSKMRRRLRARRIASLLRFVFSFFFLSRFPLFFCCAAFLAIEYVRIWLILFRFSLLNSQFYVSVL